MKGQKQAATSRLFYGSTTFLSLFYFIFEWIGINWVLQTLPLSISVHERVLFFGLMVLGLVPLALVIQFIYYDFKDFFT